MKASITEEGNPNNALSKVKSEWHFAGEDKINNFRNGKKQLQERELSVESLIKQSGDGVGWFGGIGTDLLNCLTENVSPVVSGVATFVHKTAVSVANEIAQLERDGELNAESDATDRSFEECVDEDNLTTDCNITYSSSFDSSTQTKSQNLILPWEIRQDPSQDPTFKEDEAIPVYFTDTELMKKMLALSSQESTFLHPFKDESSDGNEFQNQISSSWCSTFVMDEARIKLIHRILDIDENLASAHSKLTGGLSNSVQALFWKNYFFHCERVRANEFCERKKHHQTKETKNKSPWQTSLMEEDIKLKDARSDDDYESLVPVGSDIEGEEDDADSFVIQSPPNTGNTFATSRSIDDDLVLVDTHENLMKEKEL